MAGADEPGDDADGPDDEAEEPGDDADGPGDEGSGPLLRFAKSLTAFIKELLKERKELLDTFKTRKVRGALGVLVVVALTCCTAWLTYDLWPRTYVLRISGGDMLSNRHYLAQVLQREARKKGIILVVQPTATVLEALEKVRAAGAGAKDGLDLAFVPGGAETTAHGGIEHVATLFPEMIHLLVKPPTKGITDLKGKTVNMGPKNKAGHEVFVTLTRYAGFTAGVNFVEQNLGPEELLELPKNGHVPDAILVSSSVPSYLVEELVRKHSYQLAEIPFPKALALRKGWAGDGTILAYTYQTEPAPVPDRDIVTVALNVHLVAHSQVDPKAISTLLEVLYSPAVGNIVPLDEKRIRVPSGYPLSAGLTAYLARNEPLFTRESGEKYKTLLGLFLAVASLRAAVRRSFAPKLEKVDGYEKALVRYHEELRTLEKNPPSDAATKAWLDFLCDKLQSLCNDLHELQTMKKDEGIERLVRDTLHRANAVYGRAVGLRDNAPLHRANAVYGRAVGLRDNAPGPKKPSGGEE